MYVICSEEHFVEISSPNECDKILKIPNEQTEPTDNMANCSTDVPMFVFLASKTLEAFPTHGSFLLQIVNSPPMNI